MKFLDNIRVAPKLGLLIFVAFFTLSVMGYTGYYYLERSNEKMRLLYDERLIPIEVINELRTDIGKSNAATLESMLTTDDKRNQELKSMIAALVEKSNSEFKMLETNKLDSKEREIFDKITAAKNKFRDARAVVMNLAMQNKNAEAYALYVSNVQPMAGAYIGGLDDLADYYSQQAEQMKIDNQAAFESSIRLVLAVFGIASVVLLVNGYFIIVSITGPIAKMVMVCKEFAEGDFRDKPRKVLRKDEIGQLADALADMRNNLRSLMKKVTESTDHVASSAEELTASAEQSAQAASQVASSITDVSRGMEAQVAAVDETSAVVEQISAGVQQIAANANEVAGRSAQLAGKANEGNKSASAAINQITNAQKTVTASAGVVAKLGERSKEIGQIVETISGIAGQTNLLALNAAIEAARAGEHGRGFAVVAEEVRKLAEQSQEAAKQIVTLIGGIQNDTDDAVLAMSEGTREVKLGAELVNASGQAFQEIASLVTEVSGQIREISNAIEQMAVGNQNIVKSIKRIDELSRNASGEAQTVSAATEEQTATMEEIAASSQALARLADDLRDAVAKFQI